MKRRMGFLSVITFLFLGTCMLSLGVPTQSLAANFTLDEATNLFNPVGDFIVAGVDSGLAASPGHVIEVLKLQHNGSETGSNTLSIGELYSILADEGIVESYALVFGFGLNENNGSNYVNIQDLVMTLEVPNSSDQSYSLDSNEDNTVIVANTAQGANTAEAQVQVNLGFDFMTVYNASSTEEFYIQSTIDDTTDGFEIFFLSGAFTAYPPADPGNGGSDPGNGGYDPGNGGYDPGDGGYDDPIGGGPGPAPAPEPATMLLLGTGLSVLGGLRKKIFNSKP